MVPITTYTALAASSGRVCSRCALERSTSRYSQSTSRRSRDKTPTSEPLVVWWASVSCFSLADQTGELIPSRPWNTSSVIWTAVDDRVRGGSSQSYLEPDIFWGAPVAKFHGILDDDTLGGAGFASQSTRAVSVNGSLEEPVWDLSNCTGILMTFYSAQPGKTYTLTLHDELESGLSWETSFWLNIPYNGKVVHEVTWKNFKPFYRGREVSRSPPLRTENIRRFSLMMRSFFAKQHGEFELGIDIITARC